MPSLGADMDAGTVSKWLVKPGDEVRRGDIVAVVETEKSTIEVEVFESGRVEQLLVAEGEQVPVGTPLALLSTAPEPVPAPAAAREEAAVPAGATGGGLVVSPVVRHLAGTLGVDVASIRGSGPGGVVTRQDVERAAASTRAPAPGLPGAAPEERRRRVSPLARRVAAELGVDLGTVAGSGPHGSVVEADVRRAAAAPVVAPALAAPVVAAAPAPAGTGTGAGATEPSAAAARQLAMRRAIGALMARSKREIPHYYLSTTIDMRGAVRWLEQANLERPITRRLVAPVLLLKATALAVASVPEMNGFMVDDRFEPAPSVHVGVAVSLRGGGVIAPAIHDVDRLSLDDLMAALRDLVTRARGGVLRSSEMSDPTITVTNLGELGVEAVFGVIYPPQVALVGFGRVREVAWAEAGMVGARPVVTATLSADHRVSDGHRGGLFLSTIDQLLQAPEAL